MILYTSDTKQIIKKRILKNIIFAVICVVFAVIYEYFSHQVYSIFMIGACIFPIILGAVPDAIRMMRENKKYNVGTEIAQVLQQCGIYTLTIGSVFRGILEIYGTTNANSVIYWWCGGLLYLAGLTMGLIMK